MQQAAGARGAEEQVRVLAGLYSHQADAYDRLWSLVIRPIGERLLRRLPLSAAASILDVGTGVRALLPAIRGASLEAVVVGVDRSPGMLALARLKHPGPLALMDAQRLALRDGWFEAAVAAFVLFHLREPRRCLEELARVLRPGGAAGTVTWSREEAPPARAIWDEELAAAGAAAIEMPATDNTSSLDSVDKVLALLEVAGFVDCQVWTEPVEHRWPARDHFGWHLGGNSGVRLRSLEPARRQACLERISARLERLGGDSYTFGGEVVLATAMRKPVVGTDSGWRTAPRRGSRRASPAPSRPDPTPRLEGEPIDGLLGLEQVSRLGPNQSPPPIQNFSSAAFAPLKKGCCQASESWRPANVWACRCFIRNRHQYWSKTPMMYTA
jgi:ubiquinone/menaquinone biosynthesis C-methylase UbiE